MPYWDLPFSPNVVGSTKIIEGDYYACFKAMTEDIEEERKFAGSRFRPAIDCVQTPPTEGKRPVVYLAGPERFDPDAAQKYEEMKAICRSHGLTPITPFDVAPGVPDIATDDSYTRAYNTFDRNQQHVRQCDIILANLNDFHGWEPESDTSFECGMGFQLGKQLYAYMDQPIRMRERIPNLGEAHGWRDVCGCNVENFDYPLNLMFSSSMRIFEGPFARAVDRLCEDLGGKA